jgi:hypothetical protein
VTAEVGPPSGGILRVFGSDGKTVRLSLNSSGQPSDGGIAANAGLTCTTWTGWRWCAWGATRPSTATRSTCGMRKEQRAIERPCGNGDATIQLFDAEGNVIWSAP